MVIDNAFDLVIYILYVVTVIVVTIWLVPILFTKGIEGFKKYGWSKFPKNYIDPYFGSYAFELILVSILFILGSCWLIYGFFDHRLDEIIRYIGADVLLK